MSKEEIKGFSITDASKELSIPENTLRKYLSYFSIKVEKAGRKTILSEDAIKCLNEVIHLKSNGWSLKQIKELRENPDKAKETENQEQLKDLNPDTPEAVEGNPPQAKEEEKPSNKINVLSEAKSEEKDEINQISKEDNLEELDEDDSETTLTDLKEAASVIKPPLTKDFVNKEIASQAKRASRLYRYLGSRHSPRDTAEVKADLDRRVIFLNGLRYLRDNWLDRKSGIHESPKELVKA